MGFQPDVTPGAVASSLGCHDEACGKPRTGPGHPRKGWIQVHQAGTTSDPWLCSWHCLSRYAIRRELAEAC